MAEISGLDTVTKKWQCMRWEQWKGAEVSSSSYESPALRKLGTVWELTLQQGPPGKQGPSHDASGFQSNFSCVANKASGSNCAGGTP